MVSSYLERLRETRPYAFSGLDDASALRRARVVVDTEEGPRLTMAGLLSLGTFPQGHLPQVFVSFVSYPTTTGAEVQGTRFLDNVALEGPIPLMVRDALTVLHRNMSRRAVVIGAGREDVWDYPATALREIFVNALVHRDLSPASRGAQVRVEMYPDRLVVRNPGGLFGSISTGDLGREGASTARNAALLRIREGTSLSRGRIGRSARTAGQASTSWSRRSRLRGMALPLFQDAVSWFKVTLTRGAPRGVPVGERDTARADRRSQVLEALGGADRSRADLAEATGLSDQVVSRWLRVLREAGQVEVAGSASPRSPNVRYRRTT